MSDPTTSASAALSALWAGAGQAFIPLMVVAVAGQLFIMNNTMIRLETQVSTLQTEQSILRTTVRALPAHLAEKINPEFSGTREAVIDAVRREQPTEKMNRMLAQIDQLTQEVRRMDRRLDTLRALPPVKLQTPEPDTENAPAGRPGQDGDSWERIRREPSRWGIPADLNDDQPK